MRTILPNREIPHLWAHQSQSRAQNAGRTLWFEGPTIYSYGSHFPIARHVTNARGERAILFTTRSYSKTTGRHKSMVRSAIPDGALVLPSLDPGSSAQAESVSRLVMDVSEYLARSHRAKAEYTKGYYLARASECARDAHNLARFFGLPEPEFPALDAHGAEACARAERELAAVIAKQNKERERLARLEMANKIEAWKAGRAVNPWGFPDTLLRVSPVDAFMVETSRGAAFPIEHARRAWRVLRELYATGATWQANGHTLHLGPYSLDRVDSDGTVHAGCHAIAREEIERFARVIKAE